MLVRVELCGDGSGAEQTFAFEIDDVFPAVVVDERVEQRVGALLQKLPLDVLAALRAHLFRFVVVVAVESVALEEVLPESALRERLSEALEQLGFVLVLLLPDLRAERVEVLRARAIERRTELHVLEADQLVVFDHHAALAARRLVHLVLDQTLEQALLVRVLCTYTR